MRRRGLTSDILITLAILLVLGMLLTDVVVTGLWCSKTHGLQQRHLDAVFAVFSHRFANDPEIALHQENLFANLQQQQICLVIISGNQWAKPIVNTCSAQQGTVALVQSAVQTDSGAHLNLWSQQIVKARSVQSIKGTYNIGLVQRTDVTAERLWRDQSQILVYIVVNTLILVALGFLRFYKQIVRPLDRLIDVADHYQESAQLVFAGAPQTNELAQLSTSLNTMVQRIERDRDTLKATVAALAEKNQQLQHNQKEMVRTEKLASVGRMAAGLAHEIGNPLGVAQGYLQLVSMAGCKEEERLDYANRALAELQRVDGLIRQLLDFARTSKSEPQPFDAHAMLSELVEALRVQPFLENIALELHLVSNQYLVIADKEHLRQVLLNCLMNAADAIKAVAGKADGRIVVRTQDEAEEDGRSALCIDLSDNGEGIEPALLDAVFDPFFTTKEPGAGTGLGLAVSLSLMEAMGGRMHLQSTRGEGTTVMLFLPLQAEEKEKVIPE